MRTSSESQLEIQFSVDADAEQSKFRAGRSGTRLGDAGTGGAFEVPDFDAQSQTYAQTARLAARINASHISQAEHDALLKEREEILRKKFAGAMSKPDQNRLDYVRWSLDRIEDAKHGQALDQLESYVARYEEFQRYIEGLEADLIALRRRR